MRLACILVLIGCCSGQSYNGYRTTSRDRPYDATRYCIEPSEPEVQHPVNSRFMRSDGWSCHCTLDEEGRTKLTCRSGRYRGSSTGGGLPTNSGRGFYERIRSSAADHCVYQGRLYDLNSDWKMNVNGVLMDCTCDGSAYLSCRQAQSRRIYQPTRTVNSGNRDQADLQCGFGRFHPGELFAVEQPGGYFSLCSCVGNDASCRVYTVSGEECRFPFQDNGRYYSTCSSSNPSRPPHCVTSELGVSPPTFSDCIVSVRDLNRYLGYVFTFGGNSNGAKCHFPFVVNGVRYNQCTTSSGRSRRWCSTTPNYDRDQRYGYCRESSVDSNSDTYFNRVGQPVAIECRYEKLQNLPPPTITWYKITGSGRQKLYTYDSQTHTGRTASTAGVYAGRVSMTNDRELVIKNMRVDDAGTFECDVNYPAGQIVYSSSEVALDEGPGPTNLRYIYSPRRRNVEFVWTNPANDYDSIRLEIEKVGANNFAQIILNRDRTNYIYNRITPSTAYEARVYAVTEGTDSTPAILRFTIPRVTSPNQAGGGTDDVTPSASQPLASPRVSGNDVVLRWYSQPLPDDDVTQWLVVYEDVTSGESRSVRVPSTSTSYTLRDLPSGQRYRVTLYALIDQNQIEVGRVNVMTGRPELASTGVEQKATPTSITLSWEAPISGEVTTYEIAYRERGDSRLPWRQFSIPASPNPTATIRNLSPATTYDVKITPITDQRRGVYLPVTMATVNAREGEPLGRPENLRITDVTRSSFRARWDTPNDGNNVRRYRIMFRPYPIDDGDTPTERTTHRNYYNVAGLAGGKTYIFKVYSLLDERVSEALSRIVTTVNEVCLVGGEWRRADEKFYKLHSTGGYLQNCTCSRDASGTGGRWKCDPIICKGNNGNQYTVEQRWEQKHSSGRYIEKCACKKTGTLCQFKEAVIQPEGEVIRRQLGGRLVLRCPHESNADPPTVRWSKIISTGRLQLYRFNSASQSGQAEVESGHMFGRISMPNEFEFVIDPLRASDVGLYECVVSYPNTLNEITHQARIVVESRDGRPQNPALTIPSQPETNDVTSDTISLSWDIPSDDVTDYIVEYTDVSSGEKGTVRVGSPSVVLRNLSPSTTYRVVIIPVINGQRGEGKSLTISTNQEPASTLSTTTEAPQAPNPPTNLRFDGIGQTSVRAVWNVPYGLNPIDRYRIEFARVGTNDSPETDTTKTRYYQANNLEPGTEYEFRVFSVRGDLDSNPASSAVTTNRIGRIYVQARNSRRSNYRNGDATLTCRYDKNTPGNPLVTWYKLASYDKAKFKLATFNTSAPDGNKFAVSNEAEEFSGRLSSDDSTSLLISNLISSDNGEYQCEVSYPSGGGSSKTRINIIGPPNPVVFTSPSQSEDEKEHTLSWDIEPAPRPDQFILNVRRQGSTRQTYTVFKPPGGARSFLFRNLRPGSTYEGNMVARNRLGNSAPTDFIFSTQSSGKPEPPTGLRISESNPGRVAIYVTGPTDNVQFFRIRYAPENDVDGVMEQVAESSNTREPLILTGLAPDTRYTLRVSSVNEIGESRILNGTIDTPAPLPPAPTSVVLDELGPRSASLSILGPTEGVSYYEVSYEPTTGAGTPRTVRSQENSQSVRLSLEPDLQYRLTIAAVNGYGRSPQLKTFLTTPRESLPPARPTSFAQISPRSSDVTLRWTGSTDDVDYYVIEYQAESDREPAVQETPGRQQSVVVQNLVPDTNYRVNVKAVGPGGHSPRLTGNFHTKGAVPQPTDFQLSTNSDGDVDLNVPGSNYDDVDYFIIRYFPVDNPSETTESISYGPEFSLSDLLPSTTYRVSVIAVRDEERSNPITKDITTRPEETISPEEPIKPSTPTRIQLLDTQPDEVRFRVEGSDQLMQNGDYYVIAYQPTTRDGEEEVVNETSAQVLLTGLSPITRYRLRIALVKDGVQSDTYITFVMTEPLSTIPRNVRVRNIAKHKAELTWDAPDNADQVQRYQVEYRDNSRNDLPMTTKHVPLSTPYLQLRSLEAGTEYLARVTSINRRGETSQEAATTFTTLPERSGDVPFLPKAGKINAPAGVVVSRRRPTQAELRWDRQDNPEDIDGYLIQYQPTFNRHGEPQIIRANMADTGVVLTDLTPGTEYRVNIYAVVGRRQSEPSYTTFMTTLESPTNLQANSDGSHVTASWTNPEGPRIGARFAYRLDEGDWIQEYLSIDKSNYVITLSGDEDQVMEIAVTSVGGTMESQPALIRLHTQPEPFSDVPLSGRIEDVEDRQALVVFENARNLQNGWLLTLQDNDGIIGTPIELTDNNVSYPFDTLTPAHRYVVIISDSDGNEIERHGFMTKATQPENLVVDDETHGEVSLTWRPPNESDDIIGYVVQFRPVGESDWTNVPVNQVENPSVTLGGLRPLTSYEVVLTALYRDTVTEEDKPGVSTQLRFTTPAEPEPEPENEIPPRPVSDIRFTQVGGNSIRAQWEPSPDLDTNLYRAELRLAEDNSLVSNKNSPNSYTSFYGLKPDTRYTLTVYAVRDSIKSIPETEEVYTAPLQPLAVSFENIDDRSLDVVWEASRTNHQLTNYEIILQETDSTETPLRRTVPAAVARASFDDLHPGTSYDASVRPIIRNTDTEPTAVERTSTNLPPPESLTAVNVTETTTDVAWSQPNDEIVDYLVEYRPTSTVDDYRVLVENNNQLSLENLEPNTAYVISVYSVYKNRYSSPSTIIQTTDQRKPVPEPQIVEVTSSDSPTNGDAAITLSWRPDLGSSHLVLVLDEDGQTVDEQQILRGNEITITDLNPSTSYRIELYAVDKDSGRQSTPVTFTQKTKPRAPDALNIQPTGAHTIRVTWPQIDDDGITGYLLTYRAENGETFEKVVESNEVVLDHLQPITAYQDFTIKTLTRDTSSRPFSSNRPVKTWPLPRPKNLVVSPEPDIGPTAHLLSWTPIQGYEGNYEVSYHPGDSTQSRSEVTSPGETTFTFPRLLPGITYTFTVHPVQSAVPNSQSSVRYTSSVPAPDEITVSEITETSALVQFEAPDYDTVTQFEIKLLPRSNPSSGNSHFVLPQEPKTLTLSSLRPDTEYEVQAISHAGQETSPVISRLFRTSARPTSTTQSTVTKTTTPIAEPVPLESEQLTNGDYSVRWTPYNGPLLRYKVIYRKLSGDGRPSQLSVPPSLNQVQLDRLIPGESYQVNVIAVLPNSEERNIGATRIETSDASRDRSAVIEWNERESEFVNFRVTATPQGNPRASTKTWEVRPERSSTKLTGLFPGTTYLVLVEGFTGTNYAQVMQQTIHTAVDSPTNVRALKETKNSITVQWDAPIADITGYSLTHQLDGRGPEETFTPAPRPESERATLLNLIPGRRYAIRLYARSSHGDSQPAVIWAHTAVPPPQRLQTLQETPNLLEIVWQKSAEGITHYTLRALDPNEMVIVENERIEATETSYTLTDLQPATRYHIYLTAWMDQLHSQPAYRSRKTASKISEVTSKGAKATDDGYVIRWKGRSRAVEGWKVVVEPQDGSEAFERTFDRFTKKYVLDNLLAGVSYTVKIYPFSGSIYGEPSTFTIPASQGLNPDTTTTTWTMQIPQIDYNSVTLEWNQPFTEEAPEYRLDYKLTEESDSAYRLVAPQPEPGAVRARVDNLEAGESYTIRLTASHDRPEGGQLTAQLLADVRIPFPPPTEVSVESTDNEQTLRWRGSQAAVTGYVIEYRTLTDNEDDEFTKIQLSSDARSFTFPSLVAGETYDVRLYSVNGRRKSNILQFRLFVDPSPADECTDPETGEVHQMGEHWVSELNGFRMKCSCNGRQSFVCDTGDWCHADGKIYELNQRWTKNYPNNKKEVCICYGASGYRCYPRSCLDGQNWYEDRALWTSTVDGERCTCECPEEETRGCRTICPPPEVAIPAKVENP
ncbi:unnamed protein product [Clavelina lepadiformis]|uniref:Fibronectin n=1 Tax=Clavelina lepadiformis TaxID=159417 RepID=A0ABP0F3P5_CLALP